MTNNRPRPADNNAQSNFSKVFCSSVLITALLLRPALSVTPFSFLIPFTKSFDTYLLINVSQMAQIPEGRAQRRCRAVARELYFFQEIGPPIDTASG